MWIYSEAPCSWVSRTWKLSSLWPSHLLLQICREKKTLMGYFTVFKDVVVFRNHIFGRKPCVPGSLFHTADVLVNVRWFITLWNILLQVAKRKKNVTHQFFFYLHYIKNLCSYKPPPQILMNTILMKLLKVICIVQTQQKFRGPQIMSRKWPLTWI